MQVFVEVADRGSLSAAADRLDMSRAMVSRYLADLEQWAGARLLHRSTRRLSLTPAGSETLPLCRQMLGLADELQSVSAAPDDAPRGLIRMTTAMSFGQAHLTPAVAAYVKRYPGTAVDLMVVDRAVNLVEERIDLAIRITNELDPNLIARRLSVCRSVVCASPAYLREHGTPTCAEELARHNCLTYSYFGKSLWQFEREDGPVSVPVDGNLSANEANMLLRAALEGAGVALQPTYSVAPLLHSGELVQILPDHRPADMGIYAVYASRRQLPATVRTMIDFLTTYFGESPYWDR